MFPIQYDQAIRLAANSYLPDWDWRWLKAQYFQESRLDPNAQSPVGAKGIAQFMSATWEETARLMGFPEDASALDPHYAIPAGAWYMDCLRRKWSAPRTETERRKLAQASYNAGFGSLLEAQRMSGGMNDFGSIMAYLPAVTGHDNALQTRTYVDRIAQWYAQMGGV